MTRMTFQQAFDFALQRHHAGQFQEAESVYRQILAARSDLPEVWLQLGLLLRQSGSINPAIAVLRQALYLQPENPEACNNLGDALQAAGRLDEAVASYRQALKLRADFPEAQNNLASAYQELGQIDESIAAYRQAIALMPQNPFPHYNLALVLLLHGDLKEGWAEHEWRWQITELGLAPINFTQPRWDGCEHENRRILLHCEQGYGDTFHFLRYAPLIAGRGGRVVLQCPRDLMNLVRSLEGVGQFIAHDDPLPEFDVHCPLLSAPMVLNTTLDNVPANVPYLHADPSLVNHWRPRVAGLGGRLKVGLVWAGRPDQTNDRNRSMSLNTLAPLAQVPGITFVSLQKGAASDQARNPPVGLNLVDWTSELNNFSDTAALIETLDLVLTVDTSVAHLAGAMGKPVWVMLAFVADWRYLMNRDDSPWYPTMRLFRQPKIGDWDQPIQRVVRLLCDRMEEKG